MAIAPHEYDPSSYDQNTCTRCPWDSNHAIHAEYSRNWEVFKTLKTDDRRECPHESFTCSGPRPIVRHTCTDCHLSWNDGVFPAKFVYCEVCRPQNKLKFITKDSGERESYESGMVRDVQSGKPRFDLLLPIGVPYDEQFLTRVAGLLARGAEKYSERNWEQAEGEVELARFKASALRHLIQYLAGETDEDHQAAVVFNLMGAHLVEWKLGKNDSHENS